MSADQPSLSSVAWPVRRHGPVIVVDPLSARSAQEDDCSGLDHFAKGPAAGDAQAALRIASEACHAAPHLPKSHYAYGQAWLALSEPGRAEQAFAAALQLAPAWADAWVSYGLARYRQGAIDDAMQAMAHALRHDPRHAAAAGNLGAFLRISGAAEAAELLLQHAIAQDAGNIGARLNLVADLLSEERAAEALDLLATAPEGDVRTLHHWTLQKVSALLQLRRLAEARQILDEEFEALGPIPPELAPLWHWRRVLLGLSEGRLASAGSAAAEMEIALGAMGPEAVLEHQIMARYDLAKFWSGQNEHERAFAQWQAGHELLRRLQPFSRERHLALIDANCAAFSRDRLTGVRASNADPAPVFIVGMPRSGTTLCEQILSAHAQVHGAGERAALGQAFARLGGGSGADAVRRIAGLGQPALDAAASSYLADLHALAPEKARVVDKMPGNYLNLGLAGLLLPEAKIIHCVRDPRDIGLSIFTFRFHGAHGYAHDLADLGWAIAQSDRLMAHWRAALPNPILTVRLADWVDDFDGTLARVLGHLDLPPDPNCARFYESDSRVRTVSRAQVRQPVNGRGLGRWRTYARELTPMIAELERAGMLRDWPNT